MTMTTNFLPFLEQNFKKAMSLTISHMQIYQILKRSNVLIMKITANENDIKDILQMFR